MSIERGASQRRSVGNDQNTLAGQAADAQPKSSSGESYFVYSFGPPGLQDQGTSKYVGGLESSITAVGNFPIETTAGASRSQMQARVIFDGLDQGPIARLSQKEPLRLPLNTVTPETSAKATSEVNQNGGPTTTFSQAPVVFYKLCAYDSVATTVPTRWVSTHKDLTDAPASNGGHVLIPPVIVEGQWTQ